MLFIDQKDKRTKRKNKLSLWIHCSRGFTYPITRKKRVMLKNISNWSWPGLRNLFVGVGVDGDSQNGSFDLTSYCSNSCCFWRIVMQKVWRHVYFRKKKKKKVLINFRNYRRLGVADESCWHGIRLLAAYYLLALLYFN